MPRFPLTPRVAALVAAAAAALAACSAKRSSEPFTMVGLDEVERMLGDPRVAIIDANTPEIFQEGHVPGARWYRSGPSLASVLPADKTTRLVFYCTGPS